MLYFCRNVFHAYLILARTFPDFFQSENAFTKFPTFPDRGNPVYNESSMLNKIISIYVFKFDIFYHYLTIIKLKTKTQQKDIARPLLRKILTNKIEKFAETQHKNL